MSPGLVVMGGDSRPEGCEFETQHRILDGHLFTIICCKNCIDVCLKKTENNEKEAHFLSSSPISTLNGLALTTRLSEV